MICKGPRNPTTLVKLGCRQLRSSIKQLSETCREIVIITFTKDYFIKKALECLRSPSLDGVSFVKQMWGAGEVIKFGPVIRNLFWLQVESHVDLYRSKNSLGSGSAYVIGDYLIHGEVGKLYL